MRESGRFFDAAPTLPGLEHRDLANLFLAEIVPDRAGGELGVGQRESLAFVEQAVTTRIANPTYVLDLGLQHPAVLANSNFVNLQPC